jgi:hypothetical protein
MRDLGDLARNLVERARLGRRVFRNRLFDLLVADQNHVRGLPDNHQRRWPTLPTLNFMKDDNAKERSRRDSRTDR